jgi:hypothetical protein
MSTEHGHGTAASSPAPAQFRVVTRYGTVSAEAADENQRRIEAMFAELAETRPDNISYLVLRLADDSFLHIAFHNHAEDEANPIRSSRAFADFTDGQDERRQGEFDQQRASLVGAYITQIS